jgi:hypothetical protein
VKYVATPAWNTHVGLRQPMSRTVEGPVAGGGFVPPGGFVATGPGLAFDGCFGAGGVPHAVNATMKISGRTPWL